MLSTTRIVRPQTLRLTNCLFRQQLSVSYNTSLISSECRSRNASILCNYKIPAMQFTPNQLVTIPKVVFSTDLSNLNKKESMEVKKVIEPSSIKAKLKQAMSQYGSTVIVFHITISLISLGICYMLVANGLDIEKFMERLGLSERFHKMAASSGTFATAYIIHKVFAPVRLSITLTCTPFIVRYLRKAGFIKQSLRTMEKKKD